jgi:hypothetical protein
VPVGLKVISVLFAFVGVLLLILTISASFEFSELTELLDRSGISLPLYLFANVVFPIAMIAGGVGLWYRKIWAWWVCVIAEGIEISKTTIHAFLAPHAVLGTYPIQQNLSLFIAIAVLVYLYRASIFRAFLGESLTRTRALGITVLASFFISGLFMWQTSISAADMRSNPPLQRDAPQAARP